MDPITQQAVLATAGAAGGDSLYVDDVFSTFLFTGDVNNPFSIDNGLDLDGEGGMVWFKGRKGSYRHQIFDTERGKTKYFFTHETEGDSTNNTGNAGITSFNNNGFSLGIQVFHENINGQKMVSWSWRKAPGFFDVVTFSGSGTDSANYRVSHNLGSVPGMIIIKRRDGPGGWYVYHRSLGANSYVSLNLTSASSGTSTNYWGAAPTSTDFGINEINFGTSTHNMVAYIFAHDDAQFGTAGNESIIKCGSFTGGSHTESLGFEPQFLLAKRTDGTGGDWVLVDNMRGFHPQGADSVNLRPNTTNDENTTSFHITSDGFYYSSSTATYIYMAIRRPNKPPTAGTDVYKAIIGSDSSVMTTGFTVDFHWIARHLGSPNSHVWLDRFRDNKGFLPDTNSAEIGATSPGAFESNDGLLPRNWWGQAGTTNHFFKRAPGFMDVVAYKGTGSAQSINHNLGVAPEILICKKRSSGTNRNWIVGVGAKYLVLNETGVGGAFSFMFPSSPTSTSFSISSTSFVNENNADFMAYLFASLPGISKVGSYPGTGNAINVDCGFSSGARFILIKRTDATGDWYLWNHADGIVSGNDPYRLVNDNDATQVTNTDYIDPLTSGFTVTSSAPAGLNASGGTYLFLAIA